MKKTFEIEVPDIEGAEYTVINANEIADSRKYGIFYEGEERNDILALVKITLPANMPTIPQKEFKTLIREANGKVQTEDH